MLKKPMRESDQRHIYTKSDKGGCALHTPSFSRMKSNETLTRKLHESKSRYKVNPAQQKNMRKKKTGTCHRGWSRRCPNKTLNRRALVICCAVARAKRFGRNNSRFAQQASESAVRAVQHVFGVAQHFFRRRQKKCSVEKCCECVNLTGGKKKNETLFL